MTSLTSKALWCCDPDDVPIFDRNAANALRVVSRLYQWDPGAGQSEYERFLNVWFRAYDEVEPVLDQVDLSKGLHTAR